jgi:hypothetical protein
MAAQKSAHDFAPGMAVLAQFFSWHWQYIWQAAEPVPELPALELPPPELPALELPPLELPALELPPPPTCEPALLVAPLVPAAPPPGELSEPQLTFAPSSRRLTSKAADLIPTSYAKTRGRVGSFSERGWRHPAWTESAVVSASEVVDAD